MDPQNGVFVRKHAQAVALNHDVTVLHAQPAQEQWKTEVREEANFREIVSYYPSTNKLSNALKFLKEHKQLELTAGINIKDFDIVHANILTRAGYIAQQYKKDHGIPYILTEHWSGFVTGQYNQLPGWQKKINKSVTRDAAALTCVSNFLLNHMKSELPHPNYQVIPNVVDIATQTPTTAKPNTLLTVCDLEDDKKNISGIIDAIASLPEVELNIIGDGSDRKMLEAKTADLNLQKRVTFLGRLPNEEVLKHYTTATAVIINSNVETFSVVALEAIAANKPLICTRCGGPEEIAAHSSTLFVDKNDVGVLTSAISKVLEEPSAFQHDNAHQILERYSPATVSLQFSELYNSTVG